MRATTGLLALAAAISALAVTGCANDETTSRHSFADLSSATGASGGAGPVAAPAESNALSRLNEICRSTERALRFTAKQELGTALAQSDDPPTRAELQRYYDEVVVPTRRQEYTLLSKIELPPRLADEVDAYLESFLRATRELGDGLALIKNPGLEKHVYDDAQALARKAGLERCAAG